MKSGLLTALLLTMSSSAFSQANYVLNADFEQYTFCPQNYDDIRACTYWSGIDSLQINNCDGLDYCHTCATIKSNVNVPHGTAYYQFPHSGSAFQEVVFYFNNGGETMFARQYLQGRLSKKLTAGKRYCVSFWVNLAEGAKYAVQELSAYLDNGKIDTTTQCGAPQTQYTPQVTYSGPVITDTANWIKVEGSFVANGTEQFITLGTYKDRTHATAITLPDNNYNIIVPNYAMYLVDDVSVVESTTVADAGPDKHVGYGDSVYIGRPMSEAIWCDWRVLGSSTIIGQGPGIWVKPKTSTRYVVTQTLCGNTTKDTVKVDVWAAGVTSINGQTQEYSLAPNPNDGHIQLLQGKTDASPVSIKVYNVMGTLVHSSVAAFEHNATSLNLSEIPSGVYYMVLRDSTGTAYTLRFVKK